MKIILVLLDGLGDRSYKILSHRTPLEAAVTPNLDRLACLGSNGLFHPSLPGQCLPSELAHYLLFGYDPENFPGRGLLEAVGEKVPFDDSDVLCLAHLSGVTWQKGVPILSQGRGDIEGSSQEIGRLFAAVSPYEADGIGFRLHQTRRNDAILILKGQASPYISDSDPMVAGRAMAKITPVSGNPEPEKAARTADALNNYLSHCFSVFSGHEINRHRTAANLTPANFLATQRCGRKIVQEPFSERWGLTGMLIGSGSMYGGLAHELGLTFRQDKDSRDPGDDLRRRIQLAIADSYHNFIHVHTKAPDEAAHTKNPVRKQNIIALLDQGLDELVREVWKRDDLLVVITADHSTPSSSTLIHSGEPVPVVLVGPNVRRDKIAAFDEISAAAGCLGLLRGKELMLMIINYSNRSTLLGHRLGSSGKPYIPNSYPPFKLTPSIP
jgi:2,3-bisphosphoglycerate-independent phosphoglycerate mutase